MHAKDAGDKGGCTGILRTIEQEEKKTMWHQINRAINDPSLGAVPFVQKLVQGQVVDIYEAEEMNREIQVTTEKRFDLSMSAPITLGAPRILVRYSLCHEPVKGGGSYPIGRQ
jgi:hypothetical protein